MKIFDIKPGKMVGILKNSLKDAILDGKIENNRSSAIKFITDKAKDLNIK